MKNAWLLASCFLVACSSSCAHEGAPQPPTPPGTVEPDAPISSESDAGSLQYSNSSYSYSLPSNKWQPQNSPLGSMSSFFSNAEEQASFLSSVENFAGSQSDFTLLSVRAIKESYMSILHSENVQINGEKFFAILATKETSYFRLWLLVKKGKAYTFGCKTELASQEKTEELCGQIANTITFTKE